jgi:hypothetical protein
VLEVLPDGWVEQLTKDQHAILHLKSHAMA